MSRAGAGLRPFQSGREETDGIIKLSDFLSGSFIPLVKSPAGLFLPERNCPLKISKRPPVGLSVVNLPVP